ncbi:TolC family protein [Vibrio sp. TBV020]|uniref:TolC family protein n=1 Tax=Vibrio sp. TBV020 TaxID=3137398 RepID=UPI0038CDB733
MEFLNKIGLIFIILFTAGCTLVPELDVSENNKKYSIGYEYYNDNIDSSVNFYSGKDSEVLLSKINSEYLKVLIESTKVNNSEILYYDSKVKELEISYEISNLERLPNFNLSGNSSRSKTPTSTSPLGIETISNSYSIDFGINNFEIDFWGKLDNTRKSRLSEYYSELNNKEFASSDIIYDVISTYYSIVAEQEKIKSYTKLLNSAKRNLNINESKYKQKALSEYELIQSKIIYVETNTQIKKSEQTMMRYINKLEYLTGEVITPGKIESYINTESLEPTVNIGSAEGIIKRRHDIIASEYSLIGANYNIGVARANLLPTISITALSSLASYKYGDLFSSDSKGWNVGVGLNIPIFDFGKRNKNIDYNVQKKESAYIKYSDVVSNALVEVNDSIINMSFSSYFVNENVKKFNLDEKRFYYSNLLYKEGVSDYSTVLDSSRDLINSESNYINSKLDYIKSYYELYKNLGGLI